MFIMINPNDLLKIGTPDEKDLPEEFLNELKNNKGDDQIGSVKQTK